VNFINDLVLIVLVMTVGISFTLAQHILAKTLHSRIILSLVIAGLAFWGLWALPKGGLKLMSLLYALLASFLLCNLAWSFLWRILMSTKTADLCRKMVTPSKEKES